MTRQIRVREIHPGVQIQVSNVETRTVADITKSDQLCGGQDFKTAVALRVDFTDGSFDLAHPSMMVTVIAATYKDRC